MDECWELIDLDSNRPPPIRIRKNNQERTVGKRGEDTCCTGERKWGREDETLACRGTGAKDYMAKNGAVPVLSLARRAGECAAGLHIRSRSQKSSEEVSLSSF